MTQEDFQDLVQAADPNEFVRHRLLDQSCFIFDDVTVPSVGSYEDFQRGVADLLDLNPRNVAIVGSAKFGWSMSPEKVGAAYEHGASDVDIVIVSSPLFESAWSQIRRAYFNGYSDMRNLHRNEVFSRFLVVRSNVEYSSNYLRDLRKNLLGLNKVVREKIGVEDKAKYRIYCDWSDVELYHSKGLRELQERQLDADS